MKKRALGRGLSALLPDNHQASTAAQAVVELPLDSVRENPLQPRRRFDQERLEELAASIREHGVVQPVVCTSAPEGYRLVVGERRCRAARMAGLTSVPAIVREMAGPEILEVALIENLQREDLNPIEEAQAFSYLLKERGLTQERLALSLGCSRPAISNALRLLALPVSVREELEMGVLSAGHARALLALDTERQQLAAWEVFKSRQFSVRQAEEHVRSREEKSPERSRKEGLSPDWEEIQEHLARHLGTPVTIRPRARGCGRIELSYTDPEHLERLVELLIYLGERVQARSSLGVL